MKKKILFVLLSVFLAAVVKADDNEVTFKQSPQNRGNVIDVQGTQNVFSGEQTGDKGKVAVKVDGETNTLHIDQDATNEKQTVKVSMKGQNNSVTIRQGTKHSAESDNPNASQPSEPASK